jgi:hypothetical protein
MGGRSARTVTVLVGGRSARTILVVKRARVSKAVVATGVVALVASLAFVMTSRWQTIRGADRSGMAHPRSGPGSDGAFAFLSQQHTNECGLTPSGVIAMPVSKNLQGSCCSPMQLTSYRRQVAGLSQLPSADVIPRDPYDIPAGLAQRLLGYERAIRMGPEQQSTYDDAMSMTPDKGPCCCHC